MSETGRGEEGCCGARAARARAKDAIIEIGLVEDNMSCIIVEVAVERLARLPLLQEFRVVGGNPIILREPFISGEVG